MKKTKKLSALILGGLLAIGVGAGMGANDFQKASAASPETLTCTLGTISNNTMTFSTASFTINHYKGTDSNFAAYGAPWRVYTNNYVTITPKASQKITKVVINANTNAYASAAIGWINSSTDGTPTTLGTSTNDTTIARSVSATVVTITPASGISAMKIKPSAQTRWDSIVITFDEGAPVTLTSIAVTTPPTKTSYAVGEYLNLAGLVVTGTYSNSTTANVTGACTFSPTTSTPLTTAHTSVTVSHAGVSSTSFSITVSADPAISLNKSSLKVEIGDSDTIQVTPSNFSGDPVVTVKFASTNNATGTYASASVSGMVITVTGTADGNDTLNVTATLGGQTANSNAAITVEAPSIGDWEKVTSAANLTEGKYIITAPKTAGGELMAIDNTNGTGKPPAVNLTWSGTVPSKAVYDPVKSLGTNVIWDFTTSGSNYIIKPNNASTYLYSTNANDGLKVGSTSDTWIIDFVSSYFTMQETNNSRFIQIYNSADFRAYTSITSGGQISSNADCFKMQLFKVLLN